MKDGTQTIGNRIAKKDLKAMSKIPNYSDIYQRLYLRKPSQHGSSHEHGEKKLVGDIPLFLFGMGFPFKWYKMADVSIATAADCNAENPPISLENGLVLGQIMTKYGISFLANFSQLKWLKND